MSSLKTRRHLTRAVLALASAATVSHAQVASTWIGTGIGTWQSAANWVPGVPVSGGTAVFAAAPATVTLAAPITLNHLRLDTSSQISIGVGPVTLAGPALIEAVSSKRSAPGTNYYNGHELAIGIQGISGGPTVHFRGPGAVTLTGNTSNYFASTLLDGGVRLGVTNGQALGATSSGTILINDTTLRAISTGTVTSTPVDISRGLQIHPNGGTLAGISAPLRVIGQLSGGGPLTFAGPRGVILANSVVWAGDARVVGGGSTTLQLTSNAAMPFYNSLTVGGQVSIDYGVGGVADKLGFGTISLRGGAIAFNAANSSDQVGTIVLAGGHSTLDFIGTSGTFTLRSDRLVRSERGTLLVRGDGLGSVSPLSRQNRVFFDDASNLPLVGGGGAVGSGNQSIIPFITSLTGFNTNSSMVSYDPTTGLRALRTDTDFQIDWPAAEVSTANVRTSLSPPGPRTINSLLHGGLSQSIGGNSTITITSGVMMGAGGGSLAGSITCPIEFGSAEGFITNMSVQSAVHGSDGVTSNGTVALSSIASSYTGPTTVNSGTLVILTGNRDVVPGMPGPVGADTSPITIMGRGTGAYLYILGSRAFGRDIRVLADEELLSGLEPTLRMNTATLSGNLELNGPLKFVSTSAAPRLTGTISGPGRLIFSGDAGSGTPIIFGDNSFTGGVDLGVQTVMPMSDTAFGTGPIYVGDGPGVAPAATITLGQIPNVIRNLANDFVLTDNLNLISVSVPATFLLDGSIDLNGEQRAITGLPVVAVAMRGRVFGGELRFSGNGTLSGGDNSQRLTWVTGGSLTIASNNALGGNFTRLTQVGSISPNASATLILAGGVNIPAHPLNLYSTIRTLPGGATWQGTMQSQTTSIVQVDADTFTVAGGIDGPGTGDNTPFLRKTGPGTLATPFIRTAGRLDLQSGTVSLLAGGGVSAVGSITLSGAPGSWLATLDVADNGLVIDYSTGTPIGTIANQIRSAAGLAGDWSGKGITSSTAAAMGAAFGIGYAEVTQTPFAAAGTYRGLPIVDATEVLVAFTRRGDADLSGTVDIDDFGRLASNFNAPGNWSGGDFNYDGTVDIDDFGLLAANFNQGVPAGGVNPPRSVPEPTGAAVLAVLFPRRRRKSPGC